MTEHVVLGLGVTGRAVLRALVGHGEAAVVVDDAPTAAGRALADDLGVELIAAPTADELRAVVQRSGAVLPSPGVPDHHPVFSLARDAGVPVLSEFDLATRWDDRPVVAVTGTDGKTTVTELTRAMFEAGGRHAVAVGNTEVPFVPAIEDPTIDVFVVEASSFRLLHSHHFAPDVGTWLNVAPDHLDPTGVGSHASMADYVAAKARLWADQAPDQVAIGNADDPVVAAELTAAPAQQVTFGLHDGADNHVRGDRLVLDTGDTLAEVGELHRAFPHDLANALAAAATVVHAGGSVEGARAGLLAFRGLPHRVTLVGEAGAVRWYDDSKATAPHATHAAVRAFPSVVLIAGGRNKGLDLAELAEDAEHIRAVVAIGESAPEVASAFDGRRPVRVAGSMDEAVAVAASFARPGDVVLLSPACASFDWYSSYSERGDDFVRAVEAHLAGVGAPSSTTRRRATPADDVWASRRRHPTARPVPVRRRSKAYVGLLAIITTLNLLGLVMVLSASSVVALDDYGSSWYVVTRQAMWLGLGSVACIAVLRIDYHRWRRLAMPGIVVSTVLLALVLVPGVGITVNGASRWLGYGPLSLQPSELAKLTVLLFVADLLARRTAWMDDIRLTLVPVTAVFGSIAVLLMLQPNLGTTLVLGAIVLSLLYVAGTPFVPLAGLAAAGAVLASGLALWAPYRRARVLAFLDPWADYQNTGYQNIQSLVGVASGGITGVGLGESRAKWGFLPYAHTDFIFAIIGEELGLIGALVVVALFVGLCLLGARAALLAPDRFGMLLAAGITVWFGVQAFVNIGAVIGILPITGVPLPFVSYGGSSLLFSMIGAGLLLNVARQAQLPDARRPRATPPTARRAATPAR